jgi:hypothetical protein
MSGPTPLRTPKQSPGRGSHQFARPPAIEDRARQMSIGVSAVVRRAGGSGLDLARRLSVGADMGGGASCARTADT